MLESERVDVLVRVLTLHCPKVTGASCKYKERSSSTFGGSFQMSLFGMGAGGRARASLEIGTDHEAKDGNCYEIDKFFEILAEQCVELHHGRETGDKYIRVSPVSLKKGYKKLLSCRLMMLVRIQHFISTNSSQLICLNLPMGTEST